MIINNNIPALNTHRQMGINQNAMQNSMEKLSSGLRINRAGDDAAGLAISEKMRAQINGLDQASRNAQDGISLIQTAEGALDETHSILQRMRELAVQSSNDTNTTEDRDEIQKEINQLTDEIDRIANTTEFNTQKLLDGSQKGLRDEIASKVTLQNNSAVTGLSVNTVGTGAVTETGTITITRVEGGAGDTISADNFSIANPNNLAGLFIASGTNAGQLNTDAITVSGSGSTTTLVASELDFLSSNVTLAGDITQMNSGESITISFSEQKAAQTDVSEALSFQIGANSGQNILVGIQDMSATELGVRNDDGNAIDVTSAENASAAITSINNAIEEVSAQRSQLGAFQNRMEHTIANLDNASENLSAAESRIRDVDMAAEMMEMTRANILSQASQSMLAQANQQPQSVLQLLG